MHFGADTDVGFSLVIRINCIHDTLTDLRLFETIMYLKFNDQLWDANIVRGAHCRLVKDNKAKRAEKTKAAIAEQEELDEAAENEVLLSG